MGYEEVGDGANGASGSGATNVSARDPFLWDAGRSADVTYTAPWGPGKQTSFPAFARWSRKTPAGQSGWQLHDWAGGLTVAWPSRTTDATAADRKEGRSSSAKIGYAVIDGVPKPVFIKSTTSFQDPAPGKRLRTHPEQVMTEVDFMRRLGYQDVRFYVAASEKAALRGRTVHKTHLVTSSIADGSVADLLQKLAALEAPAATRLELVRRLATALGQFHAEIGWVHCDFHKRNLLVFGDTVRVTDFGSARPATRASYHHGVAAARLSPWTILERHGPEGRLVPTHRDDLFQLGTLAVEVLTGAPLFDSRAIDSRVKGYWVGPERSDGDVHTVLPEVYAGFIAAALETIEHDCDAQTAKLVGRLLVPGGVPPGDAPLGARIAKALVSTELPDIQAGEFGAALPVPALDETRLSMLRYEDAARADKLRTAKAAFDDRGARPREPSAPLQAASSSLKEWTKRKSSPTV